MNLTGYIGETTAYDKTLMLERKDPTSWFKSPRFERKGNMKAKLMMMVAAVAVVFGARAETETVGD